MTKTASEIPSTDSMSSVTYSLLHGSTVTGTAGTNPASTWSDVTGWSNVTEWGNPTTTKLGPRGPTCIPGSPVPDIVAHQTVMYNGSILDPVPAWEVCRG